jgi:hypothetical protein
LIYSRRENVPVFSLATWEIWTRLFDSVSTAGPDLARFAEDMEASKETVRMNLQRTHQDLQRSMRIFLMPETLDLDEAAALVKKLR